MNKSPLFNRGRRVYRLLFLSIALYAIAVLHPALFFSEAARADNTGTPAEPRPVVGDAAERAKVLLEAIARNQPELAADFFFPREAFLKVKGIRNPGQYYDKLFARYGRDIQQLHNTLPGIEHATFVRFELARRGGWVDVGEEANRLPYWASRHSRLFYAMDGVVKSFEVRVLITWQGRWYITHLSEFKSSH